MEQLPVAHLSVQNVNVIIFLSQKFDRMPAADKHIIHRRLQSVATSAETRGRRSPRLARGVYPHQFPAPPEQHPFVRSTSDDALFARVNPTLTIPE
jgi:hypothetical protein